METLKLTKEELEKINQKNEQFNKNVLPFCFHELKPILQKDKVIHLKDSEVDNFFENSDYEKIYTSIEMFNKITNKLRLDFRADPYIPINSAFCLKKENKYDEIVVNDNVGLDI